MSRGETLRYMRHLEPPARLWRNRIVGYGEEVPDQLLANAKNWRIHPKGQQDALSGVLRDVGIVQNIIVNKRTGMVVDGHLRASLAISNNQPTIPVTYVDLDEAEEAEILVTLDPIGAMAAADKEKLDGLLREVSSGEAGVQKMLADLHQSAVIGRTASSRNATELRRVDGLCDGRAAAYADVENVSVHFSGGRDSSAALLWAKENLPKARIVALYVDMGADHPGFLLHVIRVARAIGIQLVVLHTAQPLFVGILDRGWPMWIAPWCQQEMYAAMYAWERTNLTPESSLIITGSRAKQARGTSSRKADDPLPSSAGFRHLAPCFDWADGETERILKESGMPVWDGYERGFYRTACWCCPGQRQRGYLVLRDQEPTLFRAFQTLEEAAGKGWGWSPSVKEHGGIADIAAHAERHLKGSKQGRLDDDGWSPDDR
jgi:3'-phosphoadenosine 5'-phosphosulfate sulfotransferase (PAPS reductase)/FAD synthetase